MLGYLTALICLAFGLALILTVYLFSGEAVIDTARSKLNDSIAERNYLAARKYVSLLVAKHKHARLGVPPFVSESISQSEYVELLLQMLSDINVGDVEQASLRFEHMMVVPSESSGDNNENTTKPPQPIEPLKHFAENLETQQALLGSRKQLAEHYASSKGILSQYILVYNDTAALFSLVPDAERAKALTPEFYIEGLLQNLPVLRGVPDNLSDATAVEAAVTEIGGSVPGKGTKEREVFSAKLEQLRSESMELRRIWGELDAEVEKQKSQEGALSAKLIRISADLEKVLTEYLVTAVSEQHSDLSKLLKVRLPEWAAIWRKV